MKRDPSALRGPDQIHYARGADRPTNVFKVQMWSSWDEFDEWQRQRRNGGERRDTFAPSNVPRLPCHDRELYVGEIDIHQELHLLRQAFIAQRDELRRATSELAHARRRVAWTKEDCDEALDILHALRAAHDGADHHAETAAWDTAREFLRRPTIRAPHAWDAPASDLDTVTEPPEDSAA